MVEDGGIPLSGRRLWIPRMSYGGARALAAAFRYLGVEADVVPQGDELTYELAGRHTSGDECLPARVTLGNFLKVTERPGFDPAKTAFFMPTAGGPCRFGQYAPFTERVLEEMGMEEAIVISPTSANGYGGLGRMAGPLLKLGWWGLVMSDALRKLLHLYRPHETEAGAADLAHEDSLDIVYEAIADRTVPMSRKLGRGIEAMEACRDRFRRVPVDFGHETMLVGVVGEIFCRLSTFSNEDLIRRLEPFGAQAWLSDITEWVWYTDEEQVKNLKLRGKRLSLDMFGVWLKKNVQHRYEQRLLAPVAGEFTGIEEPHSVREILDLSRPYLPAVGALGEMVLSVGKAAYMYGKGADGIIDISPFTCMNGIVTEAVYPKVSRDHEGIPIRTFYFDGGQTDIDNDLAIFMELVWNYNRRKTRARRRRAA